MHACLLFQYGTRTVCPGSILKRNCSKIEKICTKPFSSKRCFGHTNRSELSWITDHDGGAICSRSSNENSRKRSHRDFIQNDRIKTPLSHIGIHVCFAQRCCYHPRSRYEAFLGVCHLPVNRRYLSLDTVNFVLEFRTLLFYVTLGLTNLGIELCNIPIAFGNCNTQLLNPFHLT